LRREGEKGDYSSFYVKLISFEGKRNDEDADGIKQGTNGQPMVV
jgi:hypothetical protein